MDCMDHPRRRSSACILTVAGRVYGGRLSSVSLARRVAATRRRRTIIDDAEETGVLLLPPVGGRVLSMKTNVCCQAYRLKYRPSTVHSVIAREFFLMLLVVRCGTKAAEMTSCHQSRAPLQVRVAMAGVRTTDPSPI